MQRQARKARVAAFQAQAPDAPQGVRQVLALSVSEVDRSFAGGDRKLFFPRQLAMGIKGRGHGCTGQRQACDEPTSRDCHWLP
ncbi:hypothetical protein PFLmoz3_05270 [Pseudomonas fluorescens]|uniref:Uncharacterized protein n=1 Tax=Pseudomonas fluorescens TaxID=294 RepID=A0A109LC93_PSEFL|nr:hypothetical protein PFLmoz3_05270 [Pseudomonas fluorescens]